MTPGKRASTSGRNSGRKSQALIYLRVSQDPSGRGRSIESQEAECRADCERWGFQVAHVLTDPGISASRYTTKVRPEFQRALDLLPEVDAFVCWESSRSTRDLKAYAEFAATCRANNVLWCYSGRIHDLSDPDDEFSAGMDALLSQRESGYISKRVKRGVRWSISQGRPHGQIKWGYLREYDPRTKAYLQTIEDPDVAPVIREAVRRLLGGESQKSIVRDFERRGIKTPYGKDHWTTSQLVAVLRSPTLAGKRTHHGEIVGDGDWPAIIPLDDFLLLQRQFANGRPYSRDSNVKHLLSGLALCDVCDSRCGVLVGGPANQKPRPRGYACKRSGHVWREKSWLDEYITEIIVRRLSRPRPAEALRGSRDKDSGEDLESRIEALRSRLDGFVQAAADGQLTPTALATIEQKINGQIEELEQERVNQLAPRVAVDLAKPGDPDEVRQRWDALPLDRKRTVIRETMEIRLLRSKGSGSHRNTEHVHIRWLA